MSTVSVTECVICYTDYDSAQRRPCIGTCGHSICETCKYQMSTSKCPQCNREEAFAITTINYQVLEMMKQMQLNNGQQNSNDQQKEKPSSNYKNERKKFEEGVCSECDSNSRKLRICVDCALNKNVLISTGDGSVSLNFNRVSVDTAIAQARSMAICGDCVLDGHHSSHKTILFVKLKADLDVLFENNITEKLKKAKIEYKQAMKKLSDSFESAFLNVEKYRKTGEMLSSNDRKNHLNNVEISLEQVNNSISMTYDLIKRIEVTVQDTQKQADYVTNNKKVFSKKTVIFANADPTLVADRKQSVKDPLLIGIFDPQRKSWISVGRMPTQKSNYAVATYLNKIFIVGGMNNGSWLSAVELYDRDKNLRKDCTRLRRGRTRTSAGFHNSKLYVCGGYDGGYMSSVEIYDVESNEWREGPSLQRPRADCAVVSCNGELYVLGGYNGKEYEEKIEKLDEESGSFVIVGDMNGSRAGFGSCVFKGRIYIAGGWSNSNNTLKTVRSYDPIADSWREESSLNRERKYFTLHPTHETIFAIRGCADNWSVINEVEVLNVELEKWENFSCVTPLAPNQPPNGQAASINASST